MLFCKAKRHRKNSMLGLNMLHILTIDLFKSIFKSALLSLVFLNIFQLVFTHAAYYFFFLLSTRSTLRGCSTILFLSWLFFFFSITNWVRCQFTRDFKAIRFEKRFDSVRLLIFFFLLHPQKGEEVLSGVSFNFSFNMRCLRNRWKIKKKTLRRRKNFSFLNYIRSTNSVMSVYGENELN